VDTIRSVLLPRAVVLTQAYYVVMWVSETPATATVTSTIFNSSLQRMAVLKLNEPAGQYLVVYQLMTELLFHSFYRDGPCA
jgi:hypothetical protein